MWIAAGAKTVREESVEIGKGLEITAEGRSFGVFHPIVRQRVLASVAVPAVHHQPIDSFVLAKLQERGLSFGREADMRTLIKRTYIVVETVNHPTQCENTVGTRQLLSLGARTCLTLFRAVSIIL